MDSTPAIQPGTPSTSGHVTSTGLDENVAVTLAYALGWLTGIVFYFLESENDHVRFHASQSIVIFGGYTIVTFVLSVFRNWLFISGRGGLAFGFLSMVLALVSVTVWAAAVATWVYLLVRTYQGRDPRIPGAAGVADSIA